MASLSLFSLSFLLLTASAASTLVLPIHLERTFPIASFRLNGSTDPRVLGIHYAKVKLGTPPTEFKVIIDTGSDLLWIPCVSCQSCSYNVFNASRSATYLKVDWDKKSNYHIHYGDQSRSGGYYASDTFTFDEFHGSMVTSNSSTVVFGCSTQESKYPSDRPFDGVLGLGPGKVSVLSQLASEEMTPRVVSMCLGDYSQPGVAVGFLVFGEAVDPNMVYTPLIPHQPRYNIQLESIAVNGQVLPIDSAVFSAAKKPQGLGGLGTFVDSGTTLAHLPPIAYDSLINSIIKSVENVVPYFSLGRLCYLDSSNATNNFPSVSYNFAGGSSLELKPEEYLQIDMSNNYGPGRCIGFVKSYGLFTILGEVVLKDKIIVYDQIRRRIGWVAANCSIGANIAQSYPSEHNRLRVSIANMFLFILGTILVI